MNIIVLHSSFLWVRLGWKEPNLQNPPLAAFYHFGASRKAVIARSLTFEPRQIEGRTWWQNWPILFALQLCCWVEDLKTNSLGSRPAIWKCRKSAKMAIFGVSEPIFKRVRGAWSFLWDPGPIIVFACQWLTDWPTNLLKNDWLDLNTQTMQNMQNMQNISFLDPCDQNESDLLSWQKVDPPKFFEHQGGRHLSFSSWGTN